MKSIYDRAKKECGYTTTRFKRMLEDHGGVETAHILLRSPTMSDGSVERKRLDLTVEAQILANGRYWTLFSEKELDTARRWLAEYKDR